MEVNEIAWKDTKFGRYRKSRYGTEVRYLSDKEMKDRDEGMNIDEIKELLKGGGMFGE